MGLRERWNRKAPWSSLNAEVLPIGFPCFCALWKCSDPCQTSERVCFSERLLCSSGFSNWPFTNTFRLLATNRWENHRGKTMGENHREISYRHPLEIIGGFECPESYLVGGWATPLKNMSSSIGMMKFPIYGKMPKMATKPPTSYLLIWTHRMPQQLWKITGRSSNLLALGGFSRAMSEATGMW